MRWQFRLRSVLVAVVVVCAALAVVSVKLQQDFRREAAMQELRALRMHDSYSAPGGYRQSFDITSQSPRFPDADVERLLVALEALQRPHDLGWSNGLEIGRIDFTQSDVSPAALNRLRQSLPATEIVH